MGEKIKSLDDAVALVLNRPEHAQLMAEKFYRHYVGLQTPPRDFVDAISYAYVSSGFELKSLLRATLESKEFWDPANRYGLVKTPIDLLIGAARSTEFLGEGHWDLRRFSSRSTRIGMDWVEPPNVAGWPGGLAWAR